MIQLNLEPSATESILFEMKPYFAFLQTRRTSQPFIATRFSARATNQGAGGALRRPKHRGRRRQRRLRRRHLLGRARVGRSEPRALHRQARAHQAPHHLAAEGEGADGGEGEERQRRGGSKPGEHQTGKSGVNFSNQLWSKSSW